MPYPYAAEDHQTFNAMSLVKEGAALMIQDKNVKQELTSTILELLDNENAIELMKKKLAAFALLNADTMIAREIIKSVENSNLK